MNDLPGRVVIIGGGHAGGSAVAFLRQYGWRGAITLVGSEPILPYQRPPLSKTWLKGEGNLADLLLRPASFYQANSVMTLLGSAAVRVDRAAKTVALATGERIEYDHLILATGSQVRMLSVPGHDLAGIVSLRTLADAEHLRTLLHPGLRLAIIGAGYIGLEVAASARALGADVVVIERESRVLARVASVPLSDHFERRHAAHGVALILNGTVEAFTGKNGRVSGVCLADGGVVSCDLALIGIGAAPDDALAHAAGLDCGNGVVVDLACRTSDPAIHAIGDCTRRPLPLYRRTARLESVPNALEQAKQAAADLCGRPPPSPEVPWFWSDQYDDRLQIAGLPFDVTEIVVRGDPAARSFAIFHLAADGTVQAVEAINAPAEFMAGRMMIARRKQALAGKLQDVSCSMQDLAR